jgi:hypothetical protein
MARVRVVSLLVLLLPSCAPPSGPAGTAAGSTGESSGAVTTTGVVSTSASASTTGAGPGPDLGGPPCTDPVRCPPECDTILQDCPSGQKCTGVKSSLLAPYGGTACVPDNAGQGSPAGSICLNATDGGDTCDAGSMCVQFGAGEGACAPFCVGDADAPACDDPALVCARVDHVWPISLCVPSCDPLEYDCPDADLNVSVMVCQPAAVGFGCVLRGNLDGHALGEPCADHRDCIAAARCAPPDDVPGCAGPDGCCAAYCDLTAPSCPLAAQSCVAYYEPGEAPPDLEDVGLCAVP